MPSDAPSCKRFACDVRVAMAWFIFSCRCSSQPSPSLPPPLPKTSEGVRRDHHLPAPAASEASQDRGPTSPDETGSSPWQRASTARTPVSAVIGSDGTLSWGPAANRRRRRPPLRPIKPLAPSRCCPPARHKSPVWGVLAAVDERRGVRASGPPRASRCRGIQAAARQHALHALHALHASPPPFDPGDTAPSVPSPVAKVSQSQVPRSPSQSPPPGPTLSYHACLVVTLHQSHSLTPLPRPAISSSPPVFPAWANSSAITMSFCVSGTAFSRS